MTRWFVLAVAFAAGATYAERKMRSIYGITPGEDPHGYRALSRGHEHPDR